MTDSRIGAARRRAIQCCTIATALVAVAGGVPAQTPSATSADTSGGPRSIQVTPENLRLNNYLHELASPGVFAGMIGGGLFDQIRHKKFDDDGFAGGVGSRAAQRAVEVSVHHGLAALMHRSTDYQPCQCHGFGRKVGHALLESFTDRRDDGSRALSVPRFASAYAGDLTQLAWRHDRNPGDVVVGTTLSFGFSALFNISRELTGLAR